MRILSATFLICVISTAAFGGYGGNIGITDDRQYGSLEDPTYYGVARLNVGNRAGGCTAGFIDANLVLTNLHCFNECIHRPCTVTFWDGHAYQDTPVSPFMRPRQTSEQKENQKINGTDWAIFQTMDPNPNFKDVAPQSQLGQVNRGGFGCLRIIQDSEIPELKKIYNQIYKKYYKQCKQQDKNPIACINKLVNTELKRRNMEPLFEDGANFKIQRCNITGYHKSNKMMTTDCDSAGGDSGAPLLRGNMIIALNNSGPQGVFNNDETDGAKALNTSNFYKSVQRARQKLRMPPTSTTPPTQSTPNQQNTAPTTEEPAIITDPQEIQQITNSQLSAFECD